MGKIYDDIVAAKKERRRLLAILLDPDKVEFDEIDSLLNAIRKSPATHLFIGGSHVKNNRIPELVELLKKELDLPVILFPGHPSQIYNEANGILFLSLISGRNPDYLISHHVNTAMKLKNSNLEVISTGYILISSETKTAVEIISKTKPLPRTNHDIAVHTAVAGELLGNQLIYLECGSGAEAPVPLQTIEGVAQNCTVPIVVGGGIVRLNQLDDAFLAGATLVVIGTAFEQNQQFFNT